MSERILSVFIDESGDFGPYDFRTPYYMVAMVLHDQNVDISDNIRTVNQHICGLGYPLHAVHTGPLIRRESIYINNSRDERRSLFHALFHFARRLDFHYLFSCVKKSECKDSVTMAAKLSKTIAEALRLHYEYFAQFDKIIIYYDNGQIELTKILVSVFSTLFFHVEFRKVKPADYHLFQVADLVCTMELLGEKAEHNFLSRSEQEFFGSRRDYQKNYLKYLRKKRLLP